MAEYTDTTFLPKIQEVKHEQIYLPAIEEKNDEMEDSSLVPLQNNLTKSIASISSENLEDTKNDCKQIKEKESDGYKRCPENVKDRDNFEAIEMLAGSDCTDKEESKQKTIIHIEFVSDQSKQHFGQRSLLETNSHTSCQLIKNEPGLSLCKKPFSHQEEQITIQESNINVMKKMMFSSEPIDLHITLKFDSNILDPRNAHINREMLTLITNEISSSNEHYVNFRKSNMIVGKLKVRDFALTNEFSSDNQSSNQESLKLCKVNVNRLNTCFVESNLFGRTQESRSSYGNKGLNASVTNEIQSLLNRLMSPYIPSIKFLDNNASLRDFKSDKACASQVFVGKNQVATFQKHESLNEKDFDAIKTNGLNGYNNICNINDANKMCLTNIEHFEPKIRLNVDTRNTELLESKILDFNTMNCLGETSTNNTNTPPITKLKFCVEVETTSNSLLEVLQSVMANERGANSTMTNIYHGNQHSALTSFQHEVTNIIDQIVPYTQLEKTTKVNCEEELLIPDSTDILDLSCDKKENDCSIIINTSENHKEFVLSDDSNTSIIDLFGSNNSSPLNTLTKEDITNALNVLDANLESEKLEQNRVDSMELDMWNDVDIDEAINNSIKKFEDLTSDKSILAIPTTSEKVCQTDISCFERKSLKRMLQLEHDDYGPTKKRKLSDKSEVDDELPDLNNIELFEDDILKPISEEYLSCEEFALMNNRDICWSPVMSPEKRIIPVIYNKQEKEIDEVNDDKSLFDEEETENDQSNWSSATGESEVLWDQFVPLPDEENESNTLKGNFPCPTIPKKPFLRVGLSKTARLKSLHNKMKLL